MAASRRTTRRLLAVLVVLVAVLVGIAVWWMWYVRTPEYSVRQVARAVDAGDYQAFAAYVDVNAVVDSAVESEIERRFPEEGFGRRLVLSAKPQLEERALEALQEAIESRGASRRGLPAIAYAIGPADIRRLPSSSEEGVRFAVALPVRGELVDVRVRLVPAGERWRVVEVEQVGALMMRLGALPELDAD